MIRGAATVLRALLLLERTRKRDVLRARGRSPKIHDSCFCACCGQGQRLGSSHFGRCHVNEALNALGRRTSHSRDAARRMLGITEEDEWLLGPPKPGQVVNTP